MLMAIPWCRASIVQKRIIYFQDEGSLTKKLCEQDPTLDGVTDRPILDCCACGTAKYRLTFYGNWSEKTHPKDYPREYSGYLMVHGKHTVSALSDHRIHGLSWVRPARY
ncbi:hypothetical protein U0070_017379 [Myodes glareolus]|uniref:Spondin domain-containing protein n=1 Tax=Myodes glareolus TaxID=447135 RepID=A0AAW0K3Z3_MYOGA